MKKIFLVLGIYLMTFWLTGVAYAGGTAAGTIISNGGDAGTQHTADTAGDTIVQWLIGSTTNYATCSSVTITVSTGYAIASLPSPSDQLLTPGSTAYYAYYLRNAGNATDTFSLSVSTIDGYNWPVYLYRDDNMDGTHQPNETYIVNQSSPLAPETTFYFFVAVHIPAGTIGNSSCTVRLIVKDQNGLGSEDNWPVAGNDTLTDETVTTCNAANIAIVKGTNITQARPQIDEIVYTSTITVSGSGTAGNVIYSDRLPGNCEYVSSSLYMNIWGGTTKTLTDAQDSDEGEITESNSLVTIRLGDLAAGTSAYVQFKVKVK